MRGIVKVFVVWTLGLAVLFGSSAVSLAASKESRLGFTCTCACSTGATTPGGWLTGLPGVDNSCSAYMGVTCNVEDTAAGIIRGGTLQRCTKVEDKKVEDDIQRPRALRPDAALGVEPPLGGGKAPVAPSLK